MLRLRVPIVAPSTRSAACPVSLLPQAAGGVGRLRVVAEGAPPAVATPALRAVATDVNRLLCDTDPRWRMYRRFV